jgi:hypothetical protein
MQLQRHEEDGKIWMQLQRLEEDGKMLLQAGGMLETLVMQFFAKLRWCFRNRIGSS